MQTTNDIIDKWSGSAPYWEKHRDVIRQMFAPVTRALAEDAQIGGRNVVLDVATGPGEPALSITELVGPDGAVVGIDPVPGMIMAARRAAERQGVANARFDVAFADRLPFPSNTFDAVISRFGVMFFPSPVDGVREMLRVLKPGGRLALAVWSVPANNPFFYTASRVIEGFVPAAPRDPDAPDAMRFAETGKLRNILKEAGAEAISERLLHFNIEASVSVEEYWPLRCEMSESLREKVASLSSEQAEDLKRQAHEALREYSTPTGMSFLAEVLLITSS